MASIVRYETKPLVTSDVIHDGASCVFDAGLTQASGRFQASRPENNDPPGPRGKDQAGLVPAVVRPPPAPGA
jgi:hypothetical protein